MAENFKILDSANIVIEADGTTYYLMVVKPGQDPEAQKIDDFINQHVTNKNFVTENNMVANSINSLKTGFISVEYFGSSSSFPAYSSSVF